MVMTFHPGLTFYEQVQGFEIEFWQRLGISTTMRTGSSSWPLAHEVRNKSP